jgi:hypothetical protein
MSTSVFETDLLHHRKVPPISADIVRRFGLSSPTFLTTASTLREALKVLPAPIVGASTVTLSETKGLRSAYQFLRRPPPIMNFPKQQR